MKSVLNSLLIILFITFFIGCEKSSKDDKNDSQASTEITESDVVGFYTGRGLYNAADATIELYYGGSFELEDPYLPDGGPAFGKWVLRGKSIDFYMDGQKTFSANVSKRISSAEGATDGSNKMKVGGIILKGQLWKKVR